jgi:hypothetical protein
MGQIVQTGELAVYLQHQVKADVEASAIRVAEGWLLAACTALTEWPAPVPDDLWAWAIELAAIAYNNPLGLVQRVTDEDTRSWGTERRKEILAAARQRYGSGAATPVFSDSATGDSNFPPAPRWPDAPGICPSTWESCP